MPGDRDLQNLEQKLDALAREVRFCRRLLVIFASVFALILLAPFLAGISEYGGGIIAGVVALILAFLAGAYIIARLNPRPPQVERPRNV